MDIIDKVHTRLSTELIELVYKHIFLKENLEKIRKQKYLKQQLHIDLENYLFRKFILKLQQFFYIELLDDDTIAIFFF